jgi:ribosome-binding factor A
MPTKSNSSNRIDRLNSLLQQLVGVILKDYLEPNQGLVTVSRVEVSGDSRWAKIWISIVGGDDDSILSAINKNIYDIQGDLNRKIAMKMVPRLQFFLDTSPRYAQHISDMLNEIKETEGIESYEDGDSNAS